MTPEYADPAVGFNSSVALIVCKLRANALYCSSSSSSVASLATGRSAAGTCVDFVTTLPPQPQAAADTASKIRRSQLRFIPEFRLFPYYPAFSSPRMWGGLALPSDLSLRPRNVHVKLFQRRPHPADNLAGPQRRAQQRHPPVGGFANPAKGVPLVRCL